MGWVLQRFQRFAEDVSFNPEFICHLVGSRHVASSLPLSPAVEVQDLAQQCEEHKGWKDSEHQDEVRRSAGKAQHGVWLLGAFFLLPMALGTTFPSYCSYPLLPQLPVCKMPAVLFCR